MEPSKKLKYVEATIDGLDDKFQFKKLSVRQTREGVRKLLAILTPAMGAGIDIYNQVQKEQEILKLYVEEGVEPTESPDVSVFSLAAVLGSQLENDSALEIMDILMEGAMKNGEPYDIDEETDLDIYLRVVTGSLKVNLLNPLVKCLTEMGYSEIVGYVQTVLTTKAPDQNI